MTIRIIPRLDIKGPNLVKGIRFEGLRVLGSPHQFARAYALAGADELLYVDVVASLYGRNSILELVSLTSGEVNIPLCVAGGLRTVQDIRAALAAGADKVALNTAAVARPELIREAAERFGSSTVVVSIEAKRTPNGWEAFTDNGREPTGVDAVEWALRATALGAGELLVSSVDRDGSCAGFELELIRAIAGSVTIPVIASGGAGNCEHVCSAVLQGKADAVAVATILHYGMLGTLKRAVSASGEGNTEFLRSGGSLTRGTPASIAGIKSAMAQAQIPVRPAESAAHG